MAWYGSGLAHYKALVNLVHQAPTRTQIYHLAHFVLQAHPHKLVLIIVHVQQEASGMKPCARAAPLGLSARRVLPSVYHVLLDRGS